MDPIPISRRQIAAHYLRVTILQTLYAIYRYACFKNLIVESKWFGGGGEATISGLLEPGGGWHGMTNDEATRRSPQEIL
jgi:hypothetical protein